MTSAAGMNASIKANAELRRRKSRNLPFHKVKNGFTALDYKLEPLSRSENKKIRDSRNRKIQKDEYQKRVVGFLVLVPVLWFVQFLLRVLVNWL